MKKKNFLLIIYLLPAMLILAPTLSLASAHPQYELAATVGDLLNPNKWFEALKKNITFPISKEQEVKIPRPEEALKEAAPKLKEVNQQVKEETGIDFAKFIGWSAKVLKAFFQVIINLLEQVSQALSPSS